MQWGNKGDFNKAKGQYKKGDINNTEEYNISKQPRFIAHSETGH